MKKIFIYLSIIFTLTTNSFGQENQNKISDPIKTNTSKHRNYSYTDGIYGNINLRSSIYISNYGYSVTVGPQVSLGYTFDNTFSFGIYGGYLIDIKDLDAGVILTGIELKTHFLKRDILPYIALQTGLSILNDWGETVPGFYISPQIGCKFKITNNIGINVYLGYEYSNNLKHALNIGCGIVIGK